MKELTKSQELQEILNISEKLNIPFLRLGSYDIPKEVTQMLFKGPLSVKLALNYQVIPVAKFGPVITLAMANPLNVLALDEIRALIGVEVIPVAAAASDIIEALEMHSAPVVSLDNIKLEEIKDVTFESTAGYENENIDVYKLTEISAQESIIKIVNNMVLEAVKSRASDIHIEPFEEHTRLRYRVDGALKAITTYSHDMQDAILARIKIMSRLDITQRRIPQDGRFSVNFEGREIDFRVSLLPTHAGEKAVLRILDKEAMSLDLASLGFSPSAFMVYNEAISSVFGLILVTGPTGSGKSTTLYSMLSKLNTLDKNIVTIEDPIEYYLKGITQIQIKPDIGLSFSSCLRSVLRQSPDIIMLGEVRDLDTADVAMKAALTGHLVLTTLHTNDSLSAIPRLLDMGLEPFLIAGSLRMVSAQRLARRLCPHCKEKYTSDKDSFKKFFPEIKKMEIDLWRPKGCPECNNTGYKGRVSIVEALLIDDKIKEMIIKRAPLSEIKDYAKARGMKILREDGLAKALTAETSLEEVFRVTADS